MKNVRDLIYPIYITEETNCAETMLRATLAACGKEASGEECRMMAGFSGGCSTHRLCGAVIGGIAALGVLLNKGDDDSFDLSKEATAAFVERCEKRLGTVNCEQIMEKWRNEEERCLAAVLQVAEEMQQVLEEYSPE